MHILITDDKGNDFVVTKSDIKQVYSNLLKKTVVSFKGKHSAPIYVKGIVKAFYKKHLQVKKSCPKPK